MESLDGIDIELGKKGNWRNSQDILALKRNWSHFK